MEEVRELQRKTGELEAASEQEAERRSKNVSPPEHSIHSGRFVPRVIPPLPQHLAAKKGRFYEQESLYQLVLTKLVSKASAR